ncbi:hypothetical protein [Brevibacterium sp. HMSC063G07]|uniref:hypothetical protein n=1 Tax=Brevibacterium sp. HMSC063G07 TaxID=1739261 RepID=UPI00114D23C4|nr:hypothetical protein [Brevibacterium sp. HMSC063G07]
MVQLRNTHWRVRYDRVDGHGKITLRYAGRLRLLGIGHAHNRQRIILFIDGPDAIAINKTTGEIIAEYTIDPSKNYQPKKKNPHTKKGNDDPTHHQPHTQKVPGHRVNDVPGLHTTRRIGDLNP